MKKPAIFLDRDGTVCREVNYLSHPDDLEIFPFTSKALQLLKEKDFLIILITNQSGIGRGFFDKNTLTKIHKKLILELEKEKVSLDAIYFCPHISEDLCECRKPKTGMIEQAAKDFEIDLENSWVIGDKTADIETGFNAGTNTALVLTGYGQDELQKLQKNADIVGENLFEIVKKIIETRK
jgi:D-glycero-D-manno-heptose 1,7-bisphosphate phosphatase